MADLHLVLEPLQLGPCGLLVALEGSASPSPLVARRAGSCSSSFLDRLLRYVVRLDGVNANLRLVALGAAAPYFYEGRRGRYADRLEALAKRARVNKLGLWGACPRTPYNPYRGLERRP